MSMNNEKLADMLFPHVDGTPALYENMYPKRDLPDGAMVTRLGPSPTGFIHLGNIYGALTDERLAHRSGGIFYLRIEDTDSKRMVEGAEKVIIESLDFFGIHFDEGAGQDTDRGSYGPYHQSRRKDIYHCFAKELVKKGLAYPCFMTEEEIGAIRQKQEAEKKTPGIYGGYARYRDMSIEDVEDALESGSPYVLRLRSKGSENIDPETGSSSVYFKTRDGIRGEISMPENIQDIVVLKADGMPTYHFAHVVDDHLMRTTHVIRGEEWLSSLPIHIELFNALGFDIPVYCHTAVLMKLDENGNKRKLSKRKDPELSLDYYKEKGYHPDALKEYMLTILNSDFEEWRTEHPELPIEDFDFSMDKMSTSGALFDLDKLEDVSKECLFRISSSDLAAFMARWISMYRPDHSDVSSDMDYLEAILDLGRHDNKPRKDLIYAEQILDFIKYFFDGYFRVEDGLPEEVSPQDAGEIIARYKETYDHSDDQSAWFDKIRTIAADMGYAAKPKDYKKNPDDFKGHVGHVSTVIRLAVTGRSQSPDVWAIQQIMGEERVMRRLGDYDPSL